MSVKRWNGSSWIDAGNIRRWNGSAWIDASSVKRYDGSNWIETLPNKVFKVQSISPIIVNSQLISGDAKTYNYNIREPYGYASNQPEYVGHVFLKLTKNFGTLRDFSMEFVDTQNVTSAYGGYAILLNEERYAHRLANEGYGSCSNTEQAYYYNSLSASQRSFTFTTNFEVNSIVIDIHCVTDTGNNGSIYNIIINGEDYTISF